MQANETYSKRKVCRFTVGYWYKFRFLGYRVWGNILGLKKYSFKSFNAFVYTTVMLIGIYSENGETFDCVIIEWTEVS